MTVTPHRDPDAVRKVLANREEAAAIVVSDAVFSVDGALAPVAELHAAGPSRTVRCSSWTRRTPSA